MKIYGNSSEILRSDQSRQIQKTGGAKEKEVSQNAAASPRGDKVQISDAGRALAAQATNGSKGQLSPERISQVRERIMSGAYNSLEVVDQVARRMLASGDI